MTAIFPRNLHRAIVSYLKRAILLIFLHNFHRLNSQSTHYALHCRVNVVQMRNTKHVRHRRRDQVVVAHAIERTMKLQVLFLLRFDLLVLLLVALFVLVVCFHLLAYLLVHC